MSHPWLPVTIIPITKIDKSTFIDHFLGPSLVCPNLLISNGVLKFNS